jgi:hypothetical protein
MRETASFRGGTVIGWGALLSLLLLWQGCADDATCDPGYEVRDGSCVALLAPPPPNGEGGAGGVGEDPSACDASMPSTGTFGATCRDGVGHTDCGCPAPICAIQPGQETGFCTQIHCDANPAACPSGWSCFDLSAIDPSYPSTCVEDL